MIKNTDNILVGSVPFTRHSFQDALSNCLALSQSSSGFSQVIFANAYSVVIAEENADFKDVCNSSKFVYADGASILLASIILGNAVPERIPGPDFMVAFLKICQKEGKKVFFLGGKEGFPQSFSLVLKKHFPSLEYDIYVPPFGVWDAEVSDPIVERINASKAHVLWLGVSSPKQDLWIFQNKGLLNVRLAFGVGAAFDFINGSVKRAPAWIRGLGLEWAFRMMMDPRRLWRRYLFGNCRFIVLVIKQKFGLRTVKSL